MLYQLPFLLKETFAEATLAVAVLAMLLSITKPLRAMGVFIIFRPLLQPAATLHYSLASIPLGAVLPLLLIFVALIDSLRPGRKLFIREVTPLYLLILFSIPSFLISPSIVDSLSITTKIITAIGAFLLTYHNTKSKEDIYKIYKYFLISAIIPLLFGFYQYITKTGHAFENDPFNSGTRIDSVFMVWNDYGEYLSILICLLIMRYAAKLHGKPRKFEHLVFLAVLVSFILALNRGSWIALTAGLLLALIFYRGAIKARWLLLGFLVVGIAAGGTIIDRFESLDRINEYGYIPNTFKGRVDGWIYILEILAESPFTGMGAGASTTITAERGAGFSPHNDYMRVLFESGPFACLAFIAFVLTNILVHVRRSKIQEVRKINYSLCALAIYYAIISSTQNILTSATILPMILVCFALSAASTKLKDLYNTTLLTQEDNL